VSARPALRPPWARLAAGLLLGLPQGALSQQPAAPLDPGDTVAVIPSGAYEAGALRRALLGDGHRDLWSTPVPAVVLDFDRFAPAPGSGRRRVHVPLGRQGRDRDARPAAPRDARGVRGAGPDERDLPAERAGRGSAARGGGRAARAAAAGPDARRSQAGRAPRRVRRSARLDRGAARGRRREHARLRGGRARGQLAAHAGADRGGGGQSGRRGGVPARAAARRAGGRLGPPPRPMAVGGIPGRRPASGRPWSTTSSGA
jgi:hypothetical protein